MYKLELRLDVGSRAEDFTLEDYDGNTVRLGDHLDRGIVLLTFYRGGFDQESRRYLGELAGAYARLRELGVEVVAVTPELPEKVKGTAASLGLPFPVLCDTKLGVARQYDVYDPVQNWCRPAAFIIGEDGTVQYAFRGISPPNTPPVPYLLKKFEQMRTPESPEKASAR